MTAKERTGILPHVIREDGNWIYAPISLVEAQLHEAVLESARQMRERCAEALNENFQEEIKVERGGGFVWREIRPHELLEKFLVAIRNLPPEKEL